MIAVRRKSLLEMTCNTNNRTKSSTSTLQYFCLRETRSVRPCLKKKKKSTEKVEKRRWVQPKDLCAKNISETERADPTLTRLCDQADMVEKPHLWKEGLLYWDAPNNISRDTHSQIVIPLKCRTAVLRVAHAATLSGHFRERRLKSDFKNILLAWNYQRCKDHIQEMSSMSNG